jgi:hypothetical protein
MKEYECVQVGHHKKIAETIQEYIVNGWNLHTYQTSVGHHYLLFEKGK